MFLGQQIHWISLHRFKWGKPFRVQSRRSSLQTRGSCKIDDRGELPRQVVAKAAIKWLGSAVALPEMDHYVHLKVRRSAAIDNSPRLILWAVIKIIFTSRAKTSLPGG